MAAVWKKLAYADDVIANTLADANIVFYATADNTPAALAMAASTMVARLAAGDIVAATPTEIRTLLSVASGATANAKISAATLDTGSDDTGFATALAIRDSHNVPHVVPSDDGKVMTSNGTDWVSEVPAAAAAHNLLADGSHGDVLNDTVTDGDVIIGNVTPKWSALAISVPASTHINHLAVANGETRPSWKALFDATVPGTIGVSDAAAAGSAVVAARRDHVHASPATFPPTAHALSTHSAAAATMDAAGYQITDLVVHQVADAAAKTGLTGVVGKLAFQVDTLSLYICTALA